MPARCPGEARAPGLGSCLQAGQELPTQMANSTAVREPSTYRTCLALAMTCDMIASLVNLGADPELAARPRLPLSGLTMFTVPDARSQRIGKGTYLGSRKLTMCPAQRSSAEPAGHTPQIPDLP